MAILTPEGTYHVHTDHRGAPTEVTDEAGRIVWTADYAPFGRAAVDEDPDGDGEPFVLHLRLPGQWEDPATGLHYNLARWYDPDTARYLSPDPIGQAGGLNLYAYAAADPINRIDPVGLYEIDVHYYLTYFLARMAGLPPRLALTIALAAQYVDDNWLTEPIHSVGGVPLPNLTALPLYHFTQKPADDRTTDPATRFKDPWNPQLDRLLRPFRYTWLSPCQRAQFLGEFLHAFEDTFSHRDADRDDQSKNNVPYGSKLGHAGDNHDPDQTYDVREFEWNEERTLQMAREVFERLRALYGLQAYDRNGFPIEFEDIEPTIRAFMLVGKEEAADAPRWQDSEAGALINGENADPEAYRARKARELRGKREVLDEALARYGMEPIPEYDEAEAAANRRRYLGGLAEESDESDYEGILLPEGNHPTGLMEE